MGTNQTTSLRVRVCFLVTLVIPLVFVVLFPLLWVNVSKDKSFLLCKILLLAFKEFTSVLPWIRSKVLFMQHPLLILGQGSLEFLYDILDCCMVLACCTCRPSGFRKQHVIDFQFGAHLVFT